ncbi:MAG: 16S rRNA (cytosine(1402)-N(4))-methyltransferase RsmH [Pseudomonadales bacterium]
MAHESVLLKEAVDMLVTDRTGIYVDGTFGRGGHSRAILQKLDVDGHLLAIDRDPQAVTAAGELKNDQRFAIEHGQFAQMSGLIEEHGWKGQVSGVLLDIGVSSPQLDDHSRGFSFLGDGPLDMRMDSSSGITAASWLASADENEIIKVLREYGEEKFARRMAKAVLEKRQEQAITTTAQLAEIISEANPRWEKGKHPATRAFQAIRIHINDELGQLRTALEQALDILAPGGRLVVISFHSLEDRIVKQFIRQKARGEFVHASIPIMDKDIVRRMRPVGKAIKPSEEEVDANPRSRSAVMRVAEKLL